MTETPTSDSHVGLAAEIVSAYVSKNAVRPAEIPELIASVHTALTKAAKGMHEQPVEELKPPVPIKKSITPDFIISLEDGRRYKSMKRHLTRLGLTPQDYRAKWGLPADYPMVSPNYAKARSEMAKALGLGQIRRGRAQGEAAARKETTATTPARGRRKKAVEPA
jgi:predicted transcriptional regulator